MKTRGQNEKIKKGKGPLETRRPLRATLITGEEAVKYKDEELIRDLSFQILSLG